MDVKEFIELFNNFDLENIGGWLFFVKLVMWLVVCVVVGFLVYYFLLLDLLVKLDLIVVKEI